MGFAWKGETLEEYWECTLNAVTWLEADDKGDGMDMIVDDGGDMTLIIHEGKKAEDLFNANGTWADPSSTDNAEFKIVLTIIRRLLESGVTDKWNKIAKRCMGVSEETTTGAHTLRYGKGRISSFPCYQCERLCDQIQIRQPVRL